MTTILHGRLHADARENHESVVERFPGYPESDKLMVLCYSKSSLEAELEVMMKALKQVEERICEGTAPTEDVVIFTDSISALETLEGQIAGLSTSSIERCTLFYRVGVRPLWSCRPRTRRLFNETCCLYGTRK